MFDLKCAQAVCQLCRKLVDMHGLRTHTAEPHHVVFTTSRAQPCRLQTEAICLLNFSTTVSVSAPSRQYYSSDDIIMILP